MGQEKPFSIEEKFKQRDWNLSHFNKIMQDLSKQKEIPYSRSGIRVRRGFNSYGFDYSLEELKQIKKDMDISQMRSISNVFYKINTSYKRMVDFFAYLYRYYYVLDLKGLSDNKKYRSDTLKLYNNVLNLLDNFNIAQTFGNISKKVLLNGAYYGYVNVFSQNRAVLTELDPDYCRSLNNSAYGTRIVEFNLNYFNNYSSNPQDLEDTLQRFPEEIQLQWKLYNNGIISSNWVSLPPQFSCAFMLEETGVPVIFDAILDSLNYDEYKELEKEKDQDELKKILVQRFKLDEDGDLDILLEEMSQIHKGVSEMLKDHDFIDVLTTFAEDVDLKDTQSSNKNITYTNLNKMLQPKYESSGVSPEIFSSTGATSLEKSLDNVTSFMSQLIEQYQNWLSMFCYSQFNFQKLIPIVTILPVTWYNQIELVDMYLKNSQYGFSWILPYVASGKKQSTLTDTIELEQGLLQLKEKMRPLSSSFTEEGDNADGNSFKGVGGENDKAGRPTLSNEDKSEKTISNIESK